MLSKERKDVCPSVCHTLTLFQTAK